MQSEATVVVSGAEPILLQRQLQQHEHVQLKQKLVQNKLQRSEENSDVRHIQDQKPEKDQSDCDSYADVPKPPREAWLRADVNTEAENLEAPLIDTSSGNELLPCIIQFYCL